MQGELGNDLLQKEYPRFFKKIVDNSKIVCYNKEKLRKEVMIMNKTLVFDMDGTIADFYGVEGWLDDLNAENTRPYAEAEPLWDMIELVEVLNQLKALGWKIAITSWLANDSSKAFEDNTRVAKREWLERYNFPYDEIHLVKYGTTKANCTRKNGGYQILVDDNDKIRKGWTLGETINPTTENIIEIFKLLLTE